MITNKRENYRLWQSGAFGNKLRAWRTIEAWEASGFSGLVAIRQLAAGGGICIWDLSGDAVLVAFERLQKVGVDLNRLMISEMSPSHLVTLQGEYLNDVCELDGQPVHGLFTHTRLPMPMRKAFRFPTSTSVGLRSDLLLKEAMSPASYEDWQALITKYPGHVFEVSIFDCFLGDLPHRNALVWEIRRY